MHAFSCGEDGVLPEPEPPVVGPGDKDEPDEKPDKIQLGITASLQSMSQTRGIIEAFMPGHDMGVFVATSGTGQTTKNASYLLTGNLECRPGCTGGRRCRYSSISAV